MIQFIHYKDFDRSVVGLRKAGGEKRQKAERVLAVLGDLHLGATAFRALQVTNHGEGRIKHCVKFNLGGGYRLVTVQTDNFVAFCYVGDHEDTERWIESNRGLTFSKGHSGAWEPIYRSPSIEEPIRRTPAPSSERLLERMDSSKVDTLLEGVPPGLIITFASLGTTVTPVQLQAYCGGIEDQGSRTLVYDVLCLLLAGDIHAAESRLDLEIGEATPAEDLSTNELLEVLDGDQVRRIRVGSAEHQRWLKAFAKSAGATEWLLFLHPEQAAVVNADFSGPAQLSGVSGSGKTCVAIHRAVRLASASPSLRVLVVTLNRSLSGLIQRLVDVAAPDDQVKRSIQVRSFFQLCQEMLDEFEPQHRRLYADLTWKLAEHIDEVFREYYRCWVNNTAAECLLPVHHSLIAQGLDAETYTREEFDWIRTAVVEDDRSRYLSLDRSGRRIPLQEDFRARLLEGLLGWESKMRDVGVIDYLGLTTALSRHLDRIIATFDHVIIDEAQDFGTSELTILRRLCRDGQNDMFLCGDIAQHVLPKHRSLVDAGINTSGRTRRIIRNYRNSREILKAAYEVLIDNLDESLIDSSDLEILDPEYASRSSNEPVVLQAGSLREEIGYARTLASQHLANNPGHRCCIALAGYSHREVEQFAARLGIPVLRGEQGPIDEGLVLSDLEQTKGYEFHLVVIVNCRRGVLPPTGTAAEESFRHGCRLYVAMTRAREELYLSYSDGATEWLDPESPSLTFMRWGDVIDLNPAFIADPPEPLRQYEGDSADVLSLKGRDFVYAPEARGLSLEAIRKVDELVDGVGLIRSGLRVRWRDMGTLLADLESHPRARQILGPVVSEELRERLKLFQKKTRPLFADAVDEVSPSPPLQRAFTEAMFDVYRRAKSEANYSANRFLGMVTEHGGVEAARRLLPDMSDGFRELWRRKRLDLSVEYLVVQPRWASLFTEAERETARERLEASGFRLN